MPSRSSLEDGPRWTHGISKSVLLCGCIAATLLGSILWGRKNVSKHPEPNYQEKNRKLAKRDSSDVDLDAVHEFYKAVQESPLLYPYFMNVKTEKREDVLQKIACSFHKSLQKKFSPADHDSLKAIHKNLNIDDLAYNRFTKLFAHICCKGKSDNLRARMLKTFAVLKSEICTTTGKQPDDIAALFVLLNSRSKLESGGSSPSEGETGHNTNGNNTKLELNSYSHEAYFPRDSAQSLVLGRAKAWSNRSTHEQLLKKIIEMEAKVSHLASNNHALDARIQEMEPFVAPVKKRTENFFIAAQEVSAAHRVN